MTYTLREGRASLCRNELITEANTTELRVLLCLFDMQSATPTELADAALCTKEEATAALQFWRGAGIVRTKKLTTDEKSKKEAPVTENVQEAHSKKAPLRHENRLNLPGSEETAKLITERQLSDFLDACQQTAGQIFSPTDIEIAVALCEQLGLSPEYVLMLISHCYNMGKRSMPYVEKVAFTFLLDLHIDTPEKLEAHLTALELVGTMEGKLRRLFGIGERALSAKESTCFRTWLSDFGYSMPLIEAAYDKTVNATGRASVAYVHKILSRWHENGCKTVADAEILEKRTEADKQAKKSKQKTKNAVRDENTENISFNVDDFFRRALERSYGDASQTQNEQKK